MTNHQSTRNGFLNNILKRALDELDEASSLFLMDDIREEICEFQEMKENTKKMITQPEKPGIYKVTWKFVDSHEEHKGTAKWTGNIWIAEDTPGGAVIISWKQA